MTGLRVSELAARADMPPSTVRYYERVGLLRPARRAPNGYRIFDESVVDDLALIGRAKSTGMRLDDIADVVAAWRGGSCRTVKDQLRAHLSAELGRVSARMAEMDLSRRRLEAALATLAAHDAGAAANRPDADARDTDRETGDMDGDARQAGPDQCGPGCGCDAALGAHPEIADTVLADTVLADTGPANATADGGALACSLDEGGLEAQLDQWRALATAARSAERNGDTLLMRLDPGLLPAAAALVAAEVGCCPRSRFTVEVRAGQVLLTAEIPGIGAELDAQHP